MENGPLEDEWLVSTMLAFKLPWLLGGSQQSRISCSATLCFATMHTQRWQFQPKLNKQLSNWISSLVLKKKLWNQFTNLCVNDAKFPQIPQKIQIYPVGSMDGICPYYIYHKNQPNVGEYTSPMDPMGTRQKNLMADMPCTKYRKSRHESPLQTPHLKDVVEPWNPRAPFTAKPWCFIRLLVKMKESTLMTYQIPSSKLT